MPTSFAEQASAGMRASRAKIKPQKERSGRNNKIPQLNADLMANSKRPDFHMLLVAVTGDWWESQLPIEK